MPYTVSQGLQEILTRRKAEALQQQQLERQARLDAIAEQERQRTASRQAGLDELSRKNIESEILDRAESRKSLQEQRETTNEARMLGLIDSGVLAPGQTIPSGIDPEVSKVGEKYLRFKTTPHTGSEEDWINPEQKQYVGSPKELIQQRESQKILEYLKDPDIPAGVRQALQFQAQTGQNPPAGMFDRPETASIQEYNFAKSQGYKGSYTQWETESANRRRLQDPARYQWSGTDPATNLPISMNTATGTFRVAPRIEGQTPPATGGKKALGIGPKPSSSST